MITKTSNGFELSGYTGKIYISLIDLFNAKSYNFETNLFDAAASTTLQDKFYKEIISFPYSQEVGIKHLIVNVWNETKESVLEWTDFEY